MVRETNLKVGYKRWDTWGYHKWQCRGRIMQLLLRVEIRKQAETWDVAWVGTLDPTPHKDPVPQNLCVIDSPCLLSFCDLPAE